MRGPGQLPGNGHAAGVEECKQVKGGWGKGKVKEGIGGVGEWGGEWNRETE